MKYGNQLLQPGEYAYPSKKAKPCVVGVTHSWFNNFEKKLKTSACGEVGVHNQKAIFYLFVKEEDVHAEGQYL